MVVDCNADPLLRLVVNGRVVYTRHFHPAMYGKAIVPMYYVYDGQLEVLPDPDLPA
jgi:hypothetical protein